MDGLDRHNEEIQRNLEHWGRKPVLRRIYRDFHRLIAAHLADLGQGLAVELGSGIGNIKEVLPGCIRTDLFPNPWVDQVESAYRLSFPNRSVANLILFDVFHHLRYPGTALDEFKRVLLPGGRVILFEPCLSLLGRLVYGLLHPEPLGLDRKIEWQAPPGWSAQAMDAYYAAQGNASRIFLHREIALDSRAWRLVLCSRRSALAYVASGGYSKPQLYPDIAYPFLRTLERLFDLLPALFATRLLVVLQREGT